uniref:VWFD domain-containing protein n=1 Tax=Myripristis murdjan TaxID=586833 RepID=A0A667WC27_9TELE
MKLCGCMYKGRYVEAGATFLSDDHCTEKCKCNPANNKVVCTSPGCQNGYECKRVDDLVGCHPKAYANCSVSGDPHYSTFDGYTYNFQGTCVYQMAGVCSTDPSLEHFDVLVQNDARGKRVGSRTKLIKGEITYLPVNLNHGKIRIYQSGDFAEISTDFGLKVSYDWNSIVFVTVPSRYAGAMCGMCGNYNNDRKDDLQMKNGKRASSPGELGKSWRVAEIPGCVDDCKDKNHCPNCDITEKEKFETNKYCGEIRNPNGPFRRCHDKIDPQPKFESCVYDACLNNGKKGSWCNIFHAYTIECQRAGIKVDRWRRKDFCPASKMEHPKNSHYEPCGSVCHVTCGIGAPPSDCDKPCEEGWLCNDGYLLSGKDCVPIDQCGCMYNDKYHKYGEVFYADQHCTENMTVNPNVSVAKVVAVEVYGNILILRRNQIGVVMVSNAWCCCENLDLHTFLHSFISSLTSMQ